MGHGVSSYKYCGQCGKHQKQRIERGCDCGSSNNCVSNGHLWSHQQITERMHWDMLGTQDQPHPSLGDNPPHNHPLVELRWEEALELLQ